MSEDKGREIIPHRSGGGGPITPESGHMQIALHVASKNNDGRAPMEVGNFDTDYTRKKLARILDTLERTNADDLARELAQLGNVVSGHALRAEALRLTHKHGCLPDGCHKLDTPTHVFFYEQDFYVLSNFSSFQVEWKGIEFATSEHAYHYEKFPNNGDARRTIMATRSAHDAFKAAERYKPVRRKDWDDVKVGIMREILMAKAQQHEYVRRKLLATGDRVLVEDSWRDDFWGWGPDGQGQNMLGRLWMEVRDELRKAVQA